MFDRPPLLEEPFAQTLLGKIALTLARGLIHTTRHQGFSTLWHYQPSKVTHENYSYPIPLYGFFSKIFYCGLEASPLVIILN